MSGSSSSASSGGIGVFGLLGVIFICAKIFGVDPIAAWSWWWVLSPFWIGIAFVLGIIALFLIGAAIAVMFDSKAGR